MGNSVYSNCKKGIAAGVLIGLGADLNGYIGGIAGAIAFSIALMTICVFSLDLFTGKVGSNNIKVKDLAVMLGLNLVSILTMSAIHNLFSMFYLTDIFWKAIMCGMLVQIAVAAYKKNIKVLTIMSISAFVLAGYKHCIAFTYTEIVSLESIGILLVIIAGNIIGAKTISMLGVNDAKNN